MDGEPRSLDLHLRQRYEEEGARTHRYDSGSFWDRRYHALRLAAIADVIGSEVGPGVTFLDVGCGTGEYLQLAAGRGAARVTGVDLSFAYCRRLLSKRTGASVAQSRGSALPFPDGSFDVVLCSEVIEHIPAEAADEVVAELRRVCRRTVVVTTPNRTALIRRAGRLLLPARTRELDRSVGHINLIGAAALRAVLAAPGWSVDPVMSLHTCPPVIGEVLHLPARLDGMIGLVERSANRLLPAAGNGLIAVARRLA